MKIWILFLWMVARALSAVKASVSSTACFYLKSPVLWSWMAHWHISSYSSQAAHARRAGLHLNAAQRTATGGRGSHCVTLRGESSENTGESFYRSVIIDSAVGSTTSDGSGFVSFTSVQRNRPAIHHPSFPQSWCPSLRRSISIGWSHLGTGCRSDFITTAG